MSWRRELSRLRALFRRRKVAEDLKGEIRLHLEMEERENLESGMAPDEAHYAALRRFGNVTRSEEECREMWTWGPVETFLQDVRYGLRQLGRNPGFTAVVVLTLALGIGATTAIFSLVNAVMLRLLPVRDPQQLVVAQWSARNPPHALSMSSFGDCAMRARAGNFAACSLSYPMYQEMATEKNLFAGVAAFAGPAQLDLSGNGPASFARGELVSGSYFETLGVTAALGRVLEPSDEQPGAPAVAVLDYSYWQRAFGGSPSAIGRTVHFNRAAFTIVGVADRGYTRLTPGTTVDLWVTLNQAKALGLPWAGTEGNRWWLTVTARLLPGVSPLRAQAAINTLFVNSSLHGAQPLWKASDDPQLRLLAAQKALTGYLRTAFGKPLLLLMAAAALVLLIACANVAGLMLARGAAREREMAVRLALGSGRRRIVRQLLTESLLLSFAGAAVGTLLATWGATSLAAFISGSSYVPPAINLRPDWRVLFFAIGVTVLTGIGFGLAPALRGARANVSAELKGASSTATQFRSRRHFGLGSGLVAVQVALAMVVLTGAGLLIRTLDNLFSIDPGFDTRNVLLFSVAPELTGYTAKQTQNFYEILQSRLAALPGVVGVSYSKSALLDGNAWTADLFIEGQSNRSRPETQMMGVGPKYFATMGIPLLTGRVLGAADMRGPQKVAVVNQAFVRKLLKDSTPIGIQFGWQAKGPRWRIVGVVGDTKYDNLRDPEAPIAFMPLDNGFATFALRTAVPASSMIPAVVRVVNALDGNLPVTQIKTQTQAIDRLLVNERLVALLFGLFGLLGLALTCIGLYGLLSYDVARRTREIGIRTALGAQKSDVLWMVVAEGVKLAVAGLVIGIACALAVTRFLVSLLYGVKPTDLLTFAAVSAVLLGVAFLACYVPARRATQVDPMEALRCE